MNEFGRGLKALMNRERISSAILADWLDVDESYVRHVVAGSHLPGKAVMAEIESIFRRTAQQICDERDVPEKAVEMCEIGEYDRFFAAGLTKMLSQLGISRKTLSDETGMKYSSICNYADGSVVPPIGRCCRIAAYLGRSVNEIIEEGMK